MDRIEWLSGIVLRTANECDLPALEWEGEYIHYRRLYRQIFESTLIGKAIIWLANLSGGLLVGQVFVQLSSGRSELADGTQRGYIYGFRVKPAYRRSGLGSLMLEHVEQDLIARRYKYATLNVSQDNPEALDFYKRHGYRIIDKEPGEWTYIDDQGLLREVHEPAFRLIKKLANKLMIC